MYYFNDGFFEGKPDPLDGFITLVPSTRPLDEQLVLAPREDGFGVED